jgi:hypothetical protein
MMDQLPSTTSEIKEHTLSELEDLYNQAVQVDSEIFAEMRSNLLLIHGEHYNKRRSAFYRRLRDSKSLTDEQKLRLTKNHTQKICKSYANIILADAPGVGFMPKNESELQDQKQAELHHSVWLDGVDRYDIADLTEEWADDYVGVGEVACKIFWDPMGGKLKGHYQASDEDGNPQFEEDGQTPVRGEPVYEGAFVFDTIQGFNLLRAPEAKDMRKSPYLIYRYMANVETLKANHPEIADKIQACQDETQVVFEGGDKGYRQTNNETMVREMFFRPCPRYPNGYFYFFTKETFIAKDELPGGVFPIAWRAYDRIPTSARGRGPVKFMRPYQAEINRAASKMAEHQVTLGDDKLLIQDGTEISQGVALPGVRSINYQGMKPEILGGRNGSQYLEYMQAQITELYQVSNLSDEMDSETAQLDPYAMLFRAASKKRKFHRQTSGFEKFLIEVAKIYIRLAKIHLPEDQIIYAVGKSEQVNMAEFKNAADICYTIRAEAQSSDIETKFGKQLAINHALQYVSNKLEKEDIGKLMRAMPYGNFEESFSDLTLDYDLGTNLILALDRGETPQPDKYDNCGYLIKRLTSRSRKPDFKFLPQPVQMNYQGIIQLYQQLEVQKQMAIQQGQQGYIPTDGYMVTCDLYVSDPADPAKTRRARVPYSSLKWLIDHLEAQGQGLEDLENMNEGNLAEIASRMGPGGPQGAPMQPGQPPMHPRPMARPPGMIAGPGAPGPMGRPPMAAPMRPQVPMGRPGMPPRMQPQQQPPNPAGAPALAPRSL